MTDLVQLTRGVWRPRIVADDFVGRLAAILTALPPTTVVSGRTAARLHGLWLPDRGAGEPIEVIVHPEIGRPRDRGWSTRSGLRVRRHTLAPDESTYVDGIAVTTEARTWLDLARELGAADLVAAGDSALRGTATVAEMSVLVSRATHRRGVVVARAVLPLLDERSRSRPESHLRYAIVSAGLPRPEVNGVVRDLHGGWLAEPDLSYDDARLALEYNGADHATVRRMRKDITRGIDLARWGWRTEVFGPVEVFARPDQVAALVRRLRAERVPLMRQASSGDLRA